jgi:hypothetical protein
MVCRVYLQQQYRCESICLNARDIYGNRPDGDHVIVRYVPRCWLRHRLYGVIGRDRSRWDRGRIVRGLDRLRLAADATGPYLPQAVIAALHATAPSWEQTDGTTICPAYDRLIAITDSPVARANRALAVGFRDGSAPAREFLARRLAECEQN